LQRCPKCGLQNVQENKVCAKCGYGFTGKPGLSSAGQLDQTTSMPKFLADKILATGDDAGGERKIATVLCADVADYGPVSAKLKPSEVYEVIDKLFAIIADQIIRYGGSISQVTHKGVLALFGAHPAREDHAQAACHAALAIQKALHEYSEKVGKRFGVGLGIKIGLNSGPVLVGSIDEDLTGDYSEVGNTAGLAHDVQSLAKPGAIYATEETFKRAEGFFIFEELKDVKYRLTPTAKAYRLLSADSFLSSFDIRATKGLTPFVGRKKELGRLLEGLAVCLEGGCAAISIMAGPGLGKSRILHEFRKAVDGRDVTLVEGRCQSHGTGVSYHPFVRVLKERFGIQDDGGQAETRKKVKEGLKSSHSGDSEMLPYILELLSVRDSGIDSILMSSESRKDYIWESLARVLLEGAEAKPLILAIEDLHWCDKASLEFIKHLLEIMQGLKILAIFTYRPGFSPIWSGLSHHQTVTLDRLSDDDSASMVQHLIGTAEIESEVQKLILQASGGVPFFVEEFFRSWKDLKIIEKRGRGYYLARQAKDFVIPSTINDIIMARVDTLPERTKALLHTGAVIERQFSNNLIGRVIEIPEEELSSHLSLLKASGLLGEVESPTQPTYAFRHALIRDVIYNSTSAARKKALHEKIGDAIEEINRDNLSEHSEELLQHHLMSEDFEKAAKYAELAGKKARKIASFSDSVRYARERVACLAKMPRTLKVDSDLVDARTSLGLYLLQMNKQVEAKQAIDPIIGIAQRNGYKRRLSQIYTIVGTHACLIEENFEEGFNYLKEGLEISEDLNDILSLVTAKVWLGIALPPTGAFEKALHFLEEALEINTAAGALWSISMVKSLMSFVVYNYMGKLDLGLQTAREALHIAETAGDRLSRGIAHGSLGMSYYYKGRLADAERHLSRSVSLLEGANYFWEAVAYVFLGATYFEMGRFAASQNCYSKSTSVLESVHLAPSVAKLNEVATILAEVSNGRKDVEPDKLFKAYQENRYAVLSGWIARIIAQIFIAIDNRDVGAAENWTRAAIVADERVGMKVHLGRDYMLYSQLCKGKGEVAESEKFLNRAKELFRQCGADGDLLKSERETS
jgi:class 3 adenylate cyclase/tetratricopeptide (TPR) repeat protein